MTINLSPSPAPSPKQLTFGDVPIGKLFVSLGGYLVLKINEHSDIAIAHPDGRACFSRKDDINPSWIIQRILPESQQITKWEGWQI